MDRLRTLDLNLLRVFLALMEDRSVSKAADRLLLTQPAVSNALRRLRERLGDDLLVRRGNVMVPTALAQELLPFVQSAMTSLTVGLERIDTFDAARLSGPLTIGVDQYSLGIVGARLIESLAMEAPGLSVSLIVTPPHEREDMLRGGQIDYIIGQNWRASPQIGHEVLFTEHFNALVRKGHPLATVHGGITVDQYLAYSHILFSEVGPVPRNVDAGLGQIGRTRQVRATVPSLSVAAELLERSDCILNLGQRRIGPLLERYEIVALPIPLDIPMFNVALHWPDQDAGTGRNDWFRKLVKACAAP